MSVTKLDADQVPATTATLNRLVSKVFVGSGGLPSFVLPTGFTPADADPVHNLEVIRNGMVLAEGTDYSYAVSTQTVTFETASAPLQGDIVLFVSFQ